MKKLVIALTLLCASAHAQIASLTTYVGNQLPNNTSRSIAPVNVRNAVLAFPNNIFVSSTEPVTTTSYVSAAAYYGNMASLTTVSGSYVYGGQISGSGAGLYNVPTFESINATISNNQDNYTISGINTSSQVITQLRVTPTESLIISGINTSGFANGKQIQIFNDSSATGASGRLMILARESVSSTSSNRFSYARDVIPVAVTPGDNAVFTYDSTADRLKFTGGNRWNGGGSLFTQFNDYNGGDFFCTTSGTAANCGVNSTLANTTERPLGQVWQGTGSTNTGKSFVGWAQSTIDTMSLGAGAMLFMSRFNPEQLSTGAEAFKAFTGLHDIQRTNSVLPTDGVLWTYDPSKSTTNYVAVAAAGGTTTSSSVGPLVSTTQMPTFGIFCNATPSQCDYFYILGDVPTIATSITTNLPTPLTQQFSASSGLVKNNGTTAVFSNLDWWGLLSFQPRGN